MNKIIMLYISKLTKDDVKAFAINNNVYLNSNELDFIYDFVKFNYEEILDKNFNINKYKTKFSNENFVKVKELYNIYYDKYKDYL